MQLSQPFSDPRRSYDACSQSHACPRQHRHPGGDRLSHRRSRRGDQAGTRRDPDCGSSGRRASMSVKLHRLIGGDRWASGALFTRLTSRVRRARRSTVSPNKAWCWVPTTRRRRVSASSRPTGAWSSSTIPEHQASPTPRPSMTPTCSWAFTLTPQEPGTAGSAPRGARSARSKSRQRGAAQARARSQTRSAKTASSPGRTSTRAGSAWLR